MNGDSLVVDTNIVIYHLKGDRTIEALLEGKTVYLSFISKIELLGFKKLNEREQALINDFISHTRVIQSNGIIEDLAIKLRFRHTVKVPDAIVAATALFLEVPLLTADKDIARLEDVPSIFFQP